MDDSAQGDPWLRAGAYLMPWGLLIGVLYAAVFGLFWRFFGEYQGIRWVPVAAVLTADMLWCGRRLLGGAAETAGHVMKLLPESGSTPAVTAAVIVLLVGLGKFALLASLPVGVWKTPPTWGWGWEAALSHLGPLYPRPIYRPLVLMPMWGRWAVSLALAIGRSAPGASPRVRQMTRGCSLAVVCAQWLLAAALTVVYCSGSVEHLARSVITVLAILLVAYLASFTLSRLAGGQTEETTLTAGLLAELTFLAFYVGSANAIYWY